MAQLDWKSFVAHTDDEIAEGENGTFVVFAGSNDTWHLAYEEKAKSGMVLIATRHDKDAAKGAGQDHEDGVVVAQ